MNDDLKNEVMELKELVRSVHGTVVSTREYLEAMDVKVDSMKEQISDTNRFMREGFEAMSTKIDAVQEQVDGLPQRVQGAENRMDRLSEKVMDEMYPVKEKNKELDKRLLAVEAKLQAV